MSAYVIFTRESTTDQAELDAYGKVVSGTVQGHKMTPLALYGNFDLLEGDPLEGAVVLQFPTAAEARAWYDSPAYQAAAKHRQAGGKYRVFIIEGVA